MYWLRPSLAALKLEISQELAYKLKIFSWVLADLLQPLIFAYLWSYVARSTGDAEGSTLFFSYFFFLMIVMRIAQDWSIFVVTDSIASESFRYMLLRPVDYIYIIGGRSLGLKLFRLAIFLPIILVVGYLWRDMLAVDLTWARVIAFLFALLIAMGMNFIIGNIFALLAFYMKNVQGLRTLFVNTVALLSGEYIPIALFVPAFLYTTWVLFPLRYLFSFPVEIIIGTVSEDQLIQGTVVAIFYLLAGVLLYKGLRRHAINRYEAEGG